MAAPQAARKYRRKAQKLKFIRVGKTYPTGFVSNAMAIKLKPNVCASGVVCFCDGKNDPRGIISRCTINVVANAPVAITMNMPYAHAIRCCTEMYTKTASSRKAKTAGFSVNAWSQFSSTRLWI